MKKSHLLILLPLFLIFMECGGDQNPGNPNYSFNFSLPDLQGKVHSLSDFRGKVLVVNLWATWCPPCLEEVPKLNELQEKYSGQRVQVVGIALDKDSLALVAPFVKEHDIKYVILVGDQQMLSSLQNFKGVPTTMVFDQRGDIHRRFDGSFEIEQLEESLQLLLQD
jgi:thiol-disulfide isomerase/thioredoxin